VRRRRGRPQPLLLAAEQPSLAASELDFLPGQDRQRRAVGMPVLGIVNLAGPGPRLARRKPGENRQTNNGPVAHRGSLVANIVERAALAVVGIFQPGDLGAELGFARTAFEHLDLGFALGIRLVPIAGRIERRRLGRTARSEDDSGQNSHGRSERMMPHKSPPSNRANSAYALWQLGSWPLSLAPPKRPSVCARRRA